LIRDSQQPQGVLRVTRQDWHAFAAGIVKGDFSFLD